MRRNRTPQRAKQNILARLDHLGRDLDFSWFRRRPVGYTRWSETKKRLARHLGGKEKDEEKILIWKSS
jgi:hypothetical protein